MRLLREEHDLSQSQLAKRLGISASVVARYETGERLPSLTVLTDLSCVVAVKAAIRFHSEDIRKLKKKQ